ncbi:MAG: hypothetical protein A2010_16020 [Nitrospirae bacterium GWD2_57_9]|nr:MAG: hypothetical protein A2010_16020 [Nitrospirae bacterium GWD2_57_9]OGW45404.1 MAG: hypothetical protein A2078_00090 [Nitrospirae bacterium GWC2_57_9]
MPKSVQTHRQNHIERQELLKKNKMAAGLVSERFPGVSEIVLHLTYYQRGPHPVLMVRTMNFSPTDYAYFHMDCMREECKNGGFDLTSVVTGLVKARKKTVKGKICCDGKSPSLAPNHASIAYEVSIQSAKPER